MSIHKLSAGSGYDYLTRQVAVHDATDKGHTGLASYYADKGETPGRWVGSGMAGIDGLDVGYEVTANQMANLFGVGYHPLAQQRWANVDGPDVTDSELRAAMRLGAPFRIYPAHATPFQVEVATRIAALSTALRTATGGEVSLQDRARIRTEVAVEIFRAAHGRDPADAREIAATIARHTRPRTNAVSGYDLTFSPVKSVSTLWAVADPATAAAIERAHHAAVTDALTFLERHALFTRVGTDGVRQVEVRGLIAAAFTHRDSRAGDPDLHTHVAVANKVQTLASHGADGADGTPDGGGRWLSIDGRILFQAVVTASETYNTALERHLHHDLGLQFATRADRGDQPDRPDQRVVLGRQHGGYDSSLKRPVREVVGVDDHLNQAWSSRRTAIVARQGDLARAFLHDHGRPPSPIEAIQLAQQATLETRDRKKHPRSLTEQRTTWRTQAAEVLGSEPAIERMVHTALHPAPSPTATPGVTTRIDTSWLDATAAGVIAAVEARRSTWQVWHVRAEAHRALRATPDLTLTPAHTEQVVDLLVDAALETHSIALTAHDHPDSDQARGIREPDPLRRRDGSSVYTVAGTQQYTSGRILAAEARLLATAGRSDGRVATNGDVDLALLEATAHGVTLNPGQADLVRRMATSGCRLQLAIAPAGSGKTTALHALTTAWTGSGGTVVGLAPSATAAAVLSEHLHPGTVGSATGVRTGTTTDTLAKLVWSIRQLDPAQHDTISSSSAPGLGRVPEWVGRIGPDTLVVIDEAGMADTLSLDTTVAFVTARGGGVRLIGDDQQLAAIGAGGILRDLATTHGAVRLEELLRFTSPGEGAASLALRDGRPEALGFYLDHHRVHVGDPTTSADDVLTSWATDRAQGLDALMLAPTRDLVADLNHRARTHRLTDDHPRDSTSNESHPAVLGRDQSPLREVRLADGNDASTGDVIITRTNDRRLRIGGAGAGSRVGGGAGGDWVKNGDRWTIRAVHEHGALTVQHRQHGLLVTLPADYVTASVELGYATTIHAAQGVTADTVHGLLTGTESRQQLYTMLTRGRHANHVHVQVTGDGDPHTAIHPDTLNPRTATDLLETVLARDDTPTSATTRQRQQTDPAHLLGQAVARYTDAIHAAAEHLYGPTHLPAIEQTASQIRRDGLVHDPRDHPAPRDRRHAWDVPVPSADLSEQPAWPTLRARLLLLAAHDVDPVMMLRIVAARAPLATADDPAAVIAWRLGNPDPHISGADASPQPLSWLPSIPPTLAAHPDWGPYLTRRADLVRDLTTQVHTTARTAATGNSADVPAWGRPGGTTLEPALLGDLAVWRAATATPSDERRPTGPAHPAQAAAHWQHHLDARVTSAQLHDRTTTDGAPIAPSSREWAAVLSHLHTDPPSAGVEHVTAQLADHLVAMAAAGLDPATHLTQALAAGPLPDDHPVAALWWRIHPQLTPAEHTLVTMPPPHEGRPPATAADPDHDQPRPPAADTSRARLRATTAAHDRRQLLTSQPDRSTGVDR